MHSHPIIIIFTGFAGTHLHLLLFTALVSRFPEAGNLIVIPNYFFSMPKYISLWQKRDSNDQTMYALKQSVFRHISFLFW
jgi:hypothetical protein